MADNDEKFVYFNEWCPRCTHFADDETDDPCNECLTNPVALNSHKPVKFEPKDSK